MIAKLWDKLDGYKLYVGGAASILTGVAMILKDLSDGGDFSFKSGWDYILAGWAMIGTKSAIAK